ncbi:MAG TPA: hypothetical protein VLG67_01540 [Candidatus Saccharimonadales bacterium]|nr:hypothetical protein [Candidatus Saccharimonadales bacterium]
MITTESLQKEIENLKERNIKVDTNKAWEISWTRRIMLLILTYLIAGFTLTTIQNQSPWTNALIPSIGFFLSTLTIPFLRTFWQNYIYKK